MMGAVVLMILVGIALIGLSNQGGMKYRIPSTPIEKFLNYDLNRIFNHRGCKNS